MKYSVDWREIGQWLRQVTGVRMWSDLSKVTVRIGYQLVTVAYYESNKLGLLTALKART